MRYVHILMLNGRPIGDAYTSEKKAKDMVLKVHMESFVRPELISMMIK
jgi:hypothetical protein